MVLILNKKIHLTQILMRLILLVLLPFFAITSAVGQNPLSLDIKTDKAFYDYGDTIVVELTLTNNADSSYTIIGSGSCIVMMGFNDVEFEVICTTDEAEFPFFPGQSRTWSWYLNPSVLGIPDQDGIQTIRGWSAGMTDSIQIQAPKYYGGVLSVGINDNTPDEELDSLRNRINAQVIWETQNPRWEHWKITGHSIDSISIAHQDDDRFRYINPYRPLQYDSIKVSTGVSLESEIPAGYSLKQNYPNPFNPITTITYTLPEQQQVLLEVFDIMGRKVSTLIDNVQQSGTHYIVFDASNLSSGSYIYRITIGNLVHSRSMLLVK